MLLDKLCAVKREYSKGGIIILEGEITDRMGILLSGSASGSRSTPDGGVFTVALLSPGDLFADILCGAPVESPVTVTAETDCVVAFIPINSLLTSDCELNIILRNLLKESGRKYFALQSRISLLMEKQLRKKIMLYLFSVLDTGETVRLNMNRAELADYLSCERSALSRELSRMQADGLIKLDGRLVTLNRRSLKGKSES